MKNNLVSYKNRENSEFVLSELVVGSEERNIVLPFLFFLYSTFLATRIYCRALRHVELVCTLCHAVKTYSINVDSLKELMGNWVNMIYFFSNSITMWKTHAFTISS